MDCDDKEKDQAAESPEVDLSCGAEEATDNDQELSMTSLELASKVQQLEQERDSLARQLQGQLADFANFKRRTQVNLESIQERANEELILELIPIIDDFESAMLQCSADDSVMKGIWMIHARLLRVLENYGVQVIPSEGEPFDPNMHDAVEMDGEPGDELVVKQEMRKGYTYKGRVIRPSMVQVARLDKEDEE